MDIQRLRALTAPYRRDPPRLLAPGFQWGDILVQSYPPHRYTPTSVIGSIAAAPISHLTAVQPVVSLLAHEHRSQYDRLTGSLRHFNQLLTQQLQSHEADHDCRVLLILVDAFELFVQCMQRQVYDRLLSNLQALVTEACFCAAAITSAQDIDAVLDLIAYFNDEYQRFSSELSTTLYSSMGPAPSNDRQLQLQEELVVVLTLVEHSILLETALRAGLQGWKNLLIQQETQLLLN
ncbi:hypothetical protein [Paraflavitalea pollutisoli]|uniref:hypothetical protein n=1 Tax=Paraflavitalea pollutisoli TaxID=3034143 RepID=UPI0023EC7234|nr:hypothetical protein [Paraflavitalea sp. H1-2-19X]